MQTYIYSYRFNVQGGGTVSGRVEAPDHREAVRMAQEQWSSFVVVSGNVNLLANQDAARKKPFAPYTFPAAVA
jgi:hypothetical protein